MSRRIFMLLIFLTLGAVVSSCGAGGRDEPFVFPPGGPTGAENPLPPPAGKTCRTDDDCEAGERCQEESCILTTEKPCAADDECSEGEICKDEECAAGCRTDGDCENGQVCNPETTSCQTPLPENTCDVNFNATLELRADSMSDGTDIPAFCTGTSLDDDGYDHSDLICCTSANFDAPGTDAFGNEFECQEIGRVAVTRYQASAPIKLRFDLQNGGCQVFLAPTDFPEFRLENSALDASLIIDVGTHSPLEPGTTSPDPRLVGQTVVSACRETANGVEIDGLPLQFMIRLLNNWTRCQRASNDSDREFCTTPASFSEWFSTSTPATSPPPNRDVVQVIPGFANPPLLLTTGAVTQQPAVGVTGVVPISSTGIPMRLNSTGETELRIVTAFGISSDSSTNFDLGTGQLGAKLGNAVLTAEFGGTVTNPANDNGPVASLVDLQSHCGATGGGELSLTARLTLTTPSGLPVATDLPVTGDAENGIRIDAPFPEAVEDIPFAREEGDPASPALAPLFEQQATLTLTFGAGSTIPIDLDIPLTTPTAFQIENGEILNDLVIEPLLGSSLPLSILFQPLVSGNNCSSTEGIAACAAEIVLSQNPRITLGFTGRGKEPAPVLQVEELDLANPENPLGTFIPASDVIPTVQFSEKIVGSSAENKLFRISNVGVRSLEIADLQSLDANHNFRLGSVYQGSGFAKRIWRSTLDSWTVPPDGSGDLFFFLNYGPFARPWIPIPAPGTEAVRYDSSSLLIEPAGLPLAYLPLTGTAKQDRRATLALYIQDEGRFAATGAADLELKGEHLYLAKNLLLSFRQDERPRSIYLKNASDPGLEGLEVSSIAVLPKGTDPGRFTLTPEKLTFPFTLDPEGAAGTTGLRKIATLQFDPSGSDYQIFAADWVISALSRGTSTSRPKIAGGEPPRPSGSPDSEIRVALKGASGAPSGTHDLIVHRLISGMDDRLDDEFQRSLIASSTTRGVIERSINRDFDKYVEKFTLNDGIDLDPRDGKAVLAPIFTTVDTDLRNPRNPSSVDGIRLFNAPGSMPGGPEGEEWEYRFQCQESTANDRDCGYFYLYAADWAGAVDVSAGCDGSKPAIASDPQLANDVLTNVLNPQDFATGECMREFLVDHPVPGIYDPVTGEVSFKNVAVRLFSPDTPRVSKDVDSTLYLALTTECVTAPFVPDPNAFPNRLVPSQTTSDDDFNPTLMGGPNPISLYVGNGCSNPAELHGRRLGVPDDTDTFDVGSGAEPGPLNFDLAGAGRTSSSLLQARGKMMYIILKMEIEP